MTVITFDEGAGLFQGDITIIPTTTVGNSLPTDSTNLTAEIDSRVHGNGAVGVTATYYEKTVSEIT